MQPKSDTQLLREYAERGDEAAFTELVRRHTNLVYSAAMRQVDSPDTAADITQTVFIALAQGSRKLSPCLAEDASLAGWLCRSARNVSLNHKRNAFRQHSRERQAMEQLNPNSDNAPDWDLLRPILDEAMSELSETDYDAVVMRFYNNQDLRSIGRSLGVTDDTAQKRVSRALDKLRQIFSKSGITTTGAALSAVLSANAVLAAPAGLAASISTAAAIAGTTAATPTVIAATTTIAMTTLQKALVAVPLTAALGLGIYEAHQNSTLQSQIQTLQQHQTPLADQIRQLQRERDEATNKLAALRQENETLKSNLATLPKLRGDVARLRTELGKLLPTGAASSTIPSLLDEPLWKHQAAQLKHYFELNPGTTIPEFQFLTNNESYFALAVRVAGFDDSHPELKNDEEYRRAAAEYRILAESRLAEILGAAYGKFMETSNGRHPNSISELKPFLATPVDASILQRYELQPSSNFPDTQSKLGSEWIITQKTPIDQKFDYRVLVGSNGSFINWYQW